MFAIVFGPVCGFVAWSVVKVRGGGVEGGQPLLLFEPTSPPAIV